MSLDRRDFLLAGVAAGVGASALGRTREALARTPGPFRAPPMERVRIGFVGVGGMGMVHVENLLRIEGAELAAICDIVPEKVAKASETIVAAGQPAPRGFSAGPRDFERMCAEMDLDLVYTATPWEWHVPICLAAMKHGKHAATEVPAAYTVDDCWALVEAAEKYEKHCVMMENCCYDRLEMLMLHLTRLGLLGELLHAECGYLHDLREIKFSTEGEGLWRRAHAMVRNGNLYPTHGLGPIAQCMDINRGNQFDYLVSMSSPPRGLELYAREHFPPADPRRGEKFKLGDVNVTLIRTKRGETIYLGHNCDSPRPYSRGLVLQGTRGLIEGWPGRAYVEGKSEKPHRWDALEPWYEKYEHPLWKSERVRAATGGHGGMDYLEDVRLIECLRRGEPTDQNVYDAAAWSVITPLTEQSVAHRSRPVDIPDFTRGRWKSAPPLGIIGA
ncbi:MAG TPA: Gfo/Idh/MocA family oxidoreductase [Gemmatimonadales bacterium]|nr:Gfo/Idh/MocA family oxidoreductase [Gemmatimonadales bacterium]